MHRHTQRTDRNGYRGGDNLLGKNNNHITPIEGKTAMASSHDNTIEPDRLTRIENRLIKLDEALRGNGKPGLFTEFAVWKNTVAGLITLDIIIVGGLITLWIKGA